MATLSTDAPISPLRQRMQHDVLMRGFGPHTQQDCVRHVRRFAAFPGHGPGTATTEDIRRSSCTSGLPPWNSSPRPRGSCERCIPRPDACQFLLSPAS